MRRDPIFADYALRLCTILTTQDWAPVEQLAMDLAAARDTGRQVFLCGNGGSAANAIHLANDFLYGIAKDGGKPMKVSALPSNPAVLTCLANDISYEEVYSTQIEVFGQKGDILIVFSGSGNSGNVVSALKKANKKGLKTYAILGYGGGASLKLADVSIHFPVEDMQISEDLQMMVGHMIMQRLSAQIAPRASRPIADGSTGVDRYGLERGKPAKLRANRKQ